MLANKLKGFASRFLTRELTSRLEFEGDISITPVSDAFGLDRGTPLDRIFINRFLHKNKELIRGECLEVESTEYTRKFGQSGHIANTLKFTQTSSDTTDNEVVADLTRTETVPESRFNTFICTQTLNFIYEIDPVIDSIYKLLKPGGHALITVAGISQISRYDYERWGDFWRFTDLSLRALLTRKFFDSDCHVTTYGNVASSCLFLQGVCYEDIPDKSLLSVVDPNYQMVVCALVKKL